jgi:hypothetical protein
MQGPRFRKEGRAPVTPENEHILLTDIAGLPPIRPRDFPVSLVDATACQQTERGHSLFRVATIILVNTFHALEWRVLNGIHSQVIGTKDFKVNFLTLHDNKSSLQHKV